MKDDDTETDDVPDHLNPALDTVSAEPPAGEKRTIEHWALAKGLLPQFREGETRSMPRRVIADKMGAVDMNLRGLRGKRINLMFWKFHATKAGLNWPEGFEITEADFDAAIKKATEHDQLL